MEIKVALLVISALIAVAAAYPSAVITSKKFDCNEHTTHEATLLGIKHDLNICFHNGKRCVQQRPFIAECPVSRPPQCTLFEWMNYDKYLKLNASICHHPWGSGLCYRSKQSTIRCEAVPPPPDLLQEIEEWTEEPENDVQICEIIDGFKQCRSLSEGRKAKVSQVADCFCATDEDSGNKVCFPDNCDEAFGY